MNCQGPCLFHCYKKNSLILLLIGVLIGLCLNQSNIEKYFSKNTSIPDCKDGIGNKLKCNNMINCNWCPSNNICYNTMKFPCDKCGIKSEDNCPVVAGCSWCKKNKTCMVDTQYLKNRKICDQNNN